MNTTHAAATLSRNSIAYQFSDAGRAGSAKIKETGDALAYTAFERGDRLTADELSALGHWSMFGSDGYPIRKLGRKWAIEHSTVPHSPLYATKHEATTAWEILIAKWISLKALTAAGGARP